MIADKEGPGSSTPKKIDDLQNVIEQLKKSNIDIHLDFVNFKK